MTAHSSAKYAARCGRKSCTQAIPLIARTVRVTMNNEIESIIADLEWWIEILDDDPTPSTQFDFSKFCYVNLPVLLAEIKRLQMRTPCDTFLRQILLLKEEKQ